MHRGDHGRSTLGQVGATWPRGSSADAGQSDERAQVGRTDRPCAGHLGPFRTLDALPCRRSGSRQRPLGGQVWSRGPESVVSHRTEVRRSVADFSSISAHLLTRRPEFNPSRCVGLTLLAHELNAVGHRLKEELRKRGRKAACFVRLVLVAYAGSSVCLRERVDVKSGDSLLIHHAQKHRFNTLNRALDLSRTRLTGLRQRMTNCCDGPETVTPVSHEVLVRRQIQLTQ